MRRREGVIWREVDGRVVGLDPTSSRYFSLNASASRLWIMLGEDRAAGELADALAASDGIDRERAGSDVEAFLATLDANGLTEP